MFNKNRDISMPSLTRQIRVCMFPKNNPTNESIGLLSDALERTGQIKITSFNYLTSMFTRADLFHVHWVDELVVGVRWPKHIIKVFLFLAYFILCKILRRPIVWTVHNIGAYESNYPWLEKILWSVFLPRVNWAIHLCPESMKAIYGLTPTPPPGSVIWHCHYRSVYEPRIASRQTQRAPNNPFVFSSFGLIRPYKGFENLIRVFHSWNFQKAVLHVAGAPVFKESAQLVSQMTKLSDGDPRIKLDFRSLHTREIRDLVTASNVIVLPYRKLMNSGVAAVALSLGCPILGPAVGCILDYHQKLGSKWVLMYENELTVDDLKRAYDTFRSCDHSVPPDLEWMDPDRLAIETLELYQHLIRHKQ